MEVGDLIAIVEKMPDWSWIDYHTGDIAIVIAIRPAYLDFTIIEVVFIKNGKKHSVPLHFTKALKEKE